MFGDDEDLDGDDDVDEEGGDDEAKSDDEVVEDAKTETDEITDEDIDRVLADLDAAETHSEQLNELKETLAKVQEQTNGKTSWKQKVGNVFKYLGDKLFDAVIGGVLIGGGVGLLMGEAGDTFELF